MSKPATKDKLNYTMHGCKVQFLGMDDVLQKGDFVRELYENAFDGGGWCNSYKSDKWRGTRWHRIEDEMPAWIGKTYRDYLEFRSRDEPVANINDLMEHEVVRVVS